MTRQIGMKTLEEWERLEEIFGDSWQPPPETREHFDTIAVVGGDDREGWDIGYNHDGDPSHGTTHVFLKGRDVPDHLRYAKGGWKPVVGDPICVYSNGSSFYGMTIGGEPIYLKSEREVTLEWLLYRARKKREDYEKLDRNRASYNEKIAALPQVFQDRIARFRKNNPDFDVEYLGYELMCCVDAVKIADGLAQLVRDEKTMTEVDEWWANPSKVEEAFKYREDKSTPVEKPIDPIQQLYYWWIHLGWEKQAEMIPVDEGHSGNSFGMACQLARIYLQDPSYVSKLHGALSPLVGSQAYGDIDPETGEPG